MGDQANWTQIRGQLTPCKNTRDSQQSGRQYVAINLGSNTIPKTATQSLTPFQKDLTTGSKPKTPGLTRSDGGNSRLSISSAISSLLRSDGGNSRSSISSAISSLLRSDGGNSRSSISSAISSLLRSDGGNSRSSISSAISSLLRSDGGKSRSSISSAISSLLRSDGGNSRSSISSAISSLLRSDGGNSRSSISSAISSVLRSDGANSRSSISSAISSLLGSLQESSSLPPTNVALPSSNENSFNSNSTPRETPQRNYPNLRSNRSTLKSWIMLIPATLPGT